jgi:hypothetical protein
MLWVEASKMFQNMIEPHLVRIIATGETGPIYLNEAEKYSIKALEWIVNEKVKAVPSVPDIKSKIIKYMNKKKICTKNVFLFPRSTLKPHIFVVKF